MNCIIANQIHVFSMHDSHNNSIKLTVYSILYTRYFQYSVWFSRQFQYEQNSVPKIERNEKYTEGKAEIYQKSLWCNSNNSNHKLTFSRYLNRNARETWQISSLLWSIDWCLDIWKYFCLRYWSYGWRVQAYVSSIGRLEYMCYSP